MKKFALIAGVAALAIPAVASAKDYSRSDMDSDHYTYKKVDNSYNDGEYRIEVKSEEQFKGTAEDARRVNRSNKTLNFQVAETSDRLSIEGDTVYKISENGSRFYAPNGSYTTTNGLTVVVEDAELIRIEEPAEIVTLDDPFGGPRTRDERRN
jgi:opacity protein-like surface antigen